MDINCISIYSLSVTADFLTNLSKFLFPFLPLRILDCLSFRRPFKSVSHCWWNIVYKRIAACASWIWNPIDATVIKFFLKKCCIYYNIRSYVRQTEFQCLKTAGLIFSNWVLHHWPLLEKLYTYRKKLGITITRKEEK